MTAEVDSHLNFGNDERRKLPSGERKGKEGELPRGNIKRDCHRQSAA